MKLNKTKLVTKYVEVTLLVKNNMRYENNNEKRRIHLRQG